MVETNNKNFTPFLATSGVSQGSHLGSLLFILFINDDAEGVILIFADDIKLYTTVETHNNQKCFLEDLNYISSWSITNRLDLIVKSVNYNHFLEMLRNFVLTTTFSAM